MLIASPGGDSAGGGMGTVSRLIVTLLNRPGSGFHALILDPRGSGPAILWPVFFLRAASRLVSKLARRRVDVLHLQVSERSSFIRKGLLMLLGYPFGVRTVLHHHGAELIQTFRSGTVLMRWIMRKVVRRADVNIVLGDVWRRFLVDDVGAEPSAVVVLRNASSDVGSAGALLRSGSERRLLLLANLSPRKGVSEFIQALALLRRRGRSVPATLAGGGEVERYKAEAAAEGVADLCRFTGWVCPTLVEELFGEAAMLVLPSFHEGLPMSILEALSARVPVVATPVGGIPEVLTSEKNCVLVPPGDVEALAAAIERVLTDSVFRERIAADGRSLYEREFEPNAYIRSLLEIYGGAEKGRTA